MKVNTQVQVAVNGLKYSETQVGRIYRMDGCDPQLYLRTEGGMARIGDPIPGKWQTSKSDGNLASQTWAEASEVNITFPY